MASTSGSEPVKQSKGAARELSGSQDPEVLAREIERTREDLAETMDAIADKVSPKRVADRTKARATEVTQHAIATAKEKAAEASTTAKEAVASARGKATGQPAVATTSIAPGSPGWEPAPASAVRPEYVAGGALGVLVLLWLSRRRKARRRAAVVVKARPVGRARPVAKPRKRR